MENSPAAGLDFNTTPKADSDEKQDKKNIEETTQVPLFN